MNLEEFEDAPLFKEVEGFPDYLISEYGVVWDTRQNKELKWIKNNTFNCVNMYNHAGKKELVKIHQAVAKTYLVKPENASKIVVHKDLNRDNNHYSNLEWKIKKSPDKKAKTRVVRKDGITKEQNKKIYSVWRNIIKRCTDPLDKFYPWYGAKGISISNEWLDHEVFRLWYLENSIPGWELDKDLIPISKQNKGLIYSSDTCCFVPDYVNQWFGRTVSVPRLRNRNNIYSMSVSETVGGVRQKTYISSHNADEVLRKYYELKDDHIKSLLERMIRDSHLLGCLYKVNHRVINLLSKFDTQEFLETL